MKNETNETKGGKMDQHYIYEKYNKLYRKLTEKYRAAIYMAHPRLGYGGMHQVFLKAGNWGNELAKNLLAKHAKASRRLSDRGHREYKRYDTWRK